MWKLVNNADKTFWISIFDALCDLVLFAQLKKHGKHTWMSVFTSQSGVKEMGESTPLLAFLLQFFLVLA